MLRRLPLVCLFLLAASSVEAADRSITLASTTSTEQSGFFDHILPLFEAQTSIHVNVVAAGTGQALKIGERGDADVLLVHDRAGEEKFMAEGHGIDRRPVMFNDFIIVGPRSDPASIRGFHSAKEAFAKIAEIKASFASRGDDSGTHRMELRQWKAAEIKPTGAWYRETGQGMGPTLNIASELNAYTLSDRATWAKFKGKRDLDVLLEGDPSLYNPYSSILVNPVKSPSINAKEAKTWHEWITTAAGQKAIQSFKIEGQPVFFLPDANPSN
jgi:tungstate transport system substrate-binding protein